MNFGDRLTLRCLGLFIGALVPLGNAAHIAFTVYDWLHDIVWKPVPATTVPLRTARPVDVQLAIFREGGCNCQGTPEPWSEHRVCVLDAFEGGREMATR